MMKELIFELAGGQVYLASCSDTPGPWVMGVHGSGREALSYRDVPFYARQRDLALEAGCSFAAISMGQDVWAREEGFAKVEALYCWMTEQGYWKRCVPMASSAGGCQMFRFAEEFPERVAALAGIFPVWDVSRITLTSLEKAWGLQGEALQKAIHPNNPAAQPQKLPQVPIVICHGLNDTAVPVAEHTLRLAQVRPIQLHMTLEGHSTQAFELYHTPILLDALRAYACEEE